MPQRVRFPLVGVLMGLSRTAELVAPALLDHHRRVAFLAHEIARAAGRKEPERRTLALAGLIHDLGCLSLREKLEMLEFERSFDLRTPGAHPAVGYALFRRLPAFAEAADLLRDHHLRWEADLANRSLAEAPAACHILHLADRVSVLFLNGHRLPHLDYVRRQVRRQSGRMFAPALVVAFLGLTEERGFWHRAAHPPVPEALAAPAGEEGDELSLGELAELSRLFSQLVDFRSPFTATHACGVSAVAAALAEALSLPAQTPPRLAVAGFLHDLGMLGVPGELLAKAAPLTGVEYDLVKRHARLTLEILAPVASLGGLREWAGLHHERMDGLGYPFGRSGEALSTECRVMAVADVFVALTEGRPHRRCVEVSEALSVVRKMGEAGALDEGVVDALARDFGLLNAARTQAQSRAGEEYLRFRELAGL